MSYKYYQPNDFDLRDKYGDCTVRALSKALNVTWLEAFDLMIPICRKNQVTNVFDAPAKIRNKFLDQLGFDYHGISNKRGTRRPTVASFARTHKKGTYILNVANHEVACVDGIYYDTWDSGYACLYGYYEKRC